MKRSIGFRGQSTCWTAGGSGRLTGRSDHQSTPARRDVVTRNGSIGSLPQVAPLSIHLLTISFSFAGSGFLGGISPASMRFQRELSASFFGTITGPSLLVNAVARRLRSSPPLAFAPLWQSRQRSARIGATAESKSV